jgi:hypothetical protein
MDKMAIFVEGYTELVFIDKLIEQIATPGRVTVDLHQHKGPAGRPSVAFLRIAPSGSVSQRFILIVDCGGDDQVKTRMCAQYEPLTRAGHSRFVCVRDVFDKFTHAEIPRLRLDLPKYVKTKPALVEFILAVMEIEAWFLVEHDHFSKIDAAIAVSAIKATLGFDPSSEDMQLRLHPAADLDNCYKIGGKRYEKQNSPDTISALDYAHLYCDVRYKFPDLDRLCSAIESFIS